MLDRERVDVKERDYESSIKSGRKLLENGGWGLRKIFSVNTAIVISTGIK